jgi:GAF domain-containing protein/ActR/RegA family two-component response regulator
MSEPPERRRPSSPRRAGLPTPRAAARSARAAGPDRALRTRLRETETLLAVSRAVGTTLDLTESMRRVARETARVLGADLVGAFLVDPDQRHLRGIAGYHVPRELREAPGQLTIPIAGQRFFENAWAARRPVAAPDVAAEAGFPRELRERFRIRSALFGPMVAADGEPIGGLLAVWRTRVHRATRAEIRLVEAIGRQAGLLVDNTRLYADAERRRREAETVAELARALNASLELGTVLQRIAESARDLCRGDMAWIALRDPESGHMVYRHWVGARHEGYDAYRVEVGKGVGGQVLLTGRPFRTDDYLGDPRITKDYAALARAEGVVSQLAVPIRIGERIEGLLYVDHRARQPFADRDETILSRLAEHAAIAIQNARLYEETERRRRAAEILAEENARLFAQLGERLKETETLLAVGQALSRNLPVDAAMRGVTRELARTLGADTAGAYLLDPRIDALLPIAGYHVPPDMLPTLRDAPLPLARFALLREAWQTGKPVWTADVDSRLDPPFPGLARPRSVLFVPTLVHDEVVGGLFFAWWRAARVFTPAELRLLEGIGSQVGLALENAEFGRKTREKLRETTMLLSASHALASTLDREPLLRHFNRHVARTVGCDAVGVWLRDPATGKLEPIAGYRVPRPLLETVQTYRIDPAESPFYAEGIESRRVLVSTDVPADTRIPEALKALAPHRAQLFGPIVAKDRVVGAFIAVWWDRVPQLPPGDLALVRAMGSQAGMVLENARLFQDHERKLEELSVLYEVSRGVTGQLDVERLVHIVRDQVSRILDERNMVILLYDAERREFEVALRLFEGRPDENPTRRYPLGVGLMTRVMERRQPIRTDDYGASCREEGVEPVRTSVVLAHWLGVPMIAGDEVFGVLALRDAQRSYTESDERLLTHIAGVAALALRGARLFAEKTRAHDDLRTAQDQLVRSERLRAVGEMAAGVAHDFNNVLAAIMGRAQLLLSQVEQPGHRRQLQVIEQAALDGARTVRRIQEFTRMRRARAFELVDLNHIIDEVVEVTRSRWEDEALGRGLSYDVRVASTPIPLVAADPSELREVMTNLILNALDAMPDGGEVTLRTAVEGPHVVCIVSDTGIGMTEEVRKRVFDPFFTTKAEKGTGLGLSVAYGIITRHGGEIDVRSEPWRGSSFIVRLPASRPPGRPRATPRPAETYRRAKILVIDDEEAVRQTLADILLNEGHAVTTCADGRMGLARLHEEPFDLVFTDLGLPGLSGWEVTRLIRLRRPETPVILVTGWGDQLEEEDARNRGVDVVVAKPFEIEGVRAAVARALAVPRAAVDVETD